MDVDAPAAMATVFPGVCSERRQKSPRLPEGKAAESFCAESIEWKSHSRDSGVGAGTKLVLRSEAEEDELDRFLWWRQLNCVKAVR